MIEDPKPSLASPLKKIARETVSLPPFGRFLHPPIGLLCFFRPRNGPESCRSKKPHGGTSGLKLSLHKDTKLCLARVWDPKTPVFWNVFVGDVGLLPVILLLHLQDSRLESHEIHELMLWLRSKKCKEKGKEPKKFSPQVGQASKKGHSKKKTWGCQALEATC